MITFFSRKSTSSLALAIALASGVAVTATALFPTEASAQRRDRDRDQEEVDGGGYGDEFRAAYVPLDEALKAEGADVAALRPQIDALIPLLQTGDERTAGGGLVFNAGVASGDQSLQLQGMELMLASGLIGPDRIAQFNFIAYQLSSVTNDFGKARHYLQRSIEHNYTSDTVSAADLQVQMAETYFAEENLSEGFSFLMGAIEDREAQNLTVDEQWYRRGLLVAYENESVPQVYDFASKWVSAYPTNDNWRDAINIARNLNDFEGQEILDLFRLARRAGTLSEPHDYDYYVEVADPMRLPNEASAVINEGLTSGVISADNSFIQEAKVMAEGRISESRSDLAELEADAMAADANARIVIAAGDVFLSFDQFEKAKTFYERARSMAGVDASLANTRLGIANVGLRDYAAAREAFGQVTSANRMPIAKLWSAYASQLEGESAPAASAM